MPAIETILEYGLDNARHYKSLSAAATVLAAHSIQTFGVESVECAGRSIDYLNRGDTYTATIICENGEFSISSWGAWYKSAENEYCADNSEIRCGNCSAFTPLAASGQWRETICNNCGRNVSHS